MRKLRLVSLLAMASIAVVARAQVRYDLDCSAFVSSVFRTPFTQSFTLIVPSFVTSETTFTGAQLAASSATFNGAPDAITSVTFRPSDPLDPTGPFPDVVEIVTEKGGGLWGFDPGTMGRYGSDGSVTDVSSESLKVSPVPEPATMGALGLGAVALVRRRRRA